MTRFSKYTDQGISTGNFLIFPKEKWNNDHNEKLTNVGLKKCLNIPKGTIRSLEGSRIDNNMTIK
jgi:hypothetical protein